MKNYREADQDGDSERFGVAECCLRCQYLDLECAAVLVPIENNTEGGRLCRIVHSFTLCGLMYVRTQCQQENRKIVKSINRKIRSTARTDVRTESTHSKLTSNFQFKSSHDHDL